MPDALADVCEVLAGLDRAVADAVEDADHHAVLADVGAPVLVDEVVREVTDAVGDDPASQHASPAGAQGDDEAAGAEAAQDRGGAAGGGDTDPGAEADRGYVAGGLTRIGDVGGHALGNVVLRAEVGAHRGRGDVHEGDAGTRPGQIARDAAHAVQGVADGRDVAGAE